MTDEPEEEPSRPGRDGSVILEGEPYELVRYGSETIDGGVDPYGRLCHICSTAPGTRHERHCPMGGWHRRPQRCRDCGVGIGEVHAMNCVVERCPRCEGQYASCDCSGSEDAPEDAEGEYEG